MFLEFLAIGGNTGPKIPPKKYANGASLFLSGIQSLASLGFFQNDEKMRSPPPSDAT